jgi:hypothetical protein
MGREEAAIAVAIVSAPHSGFDTPSSPRSQSATSTTSGPRACRIRRDSDDRIILTVEHRAAAAMQGVTLELALRDNPLHSSPTSSTAIPNATPSRLLSISAPPRFPRRGRQAYHATICRQISYRPTIVGPRKRHNE